MALALISLASFAVLARVVTPPVMRAASGAALMLPSPRKNHYIIFENKNISKVKRRHMYALFKDLVEEMYRDEAESRIELAGKLAFQ